MSTPSTDRVNSVGTPASGSDSKTIELTKTFDNVARTVETAISPETGSYLHGHCFMNAVLNKVPPFFFSSLSARLGRRAAVYDCACNVAQSRLYARLNLRVAIGSVGFARSTSGVCWNPLCATRSESPPAVAALRCGRCHVAVYCTRECQRSHWSLRSLPPTSSSHRVAVDAATRILAAAVADGSMRPHRSECNAHVAHYWEFGEPGRTRVDEYVAKRKTGGLGMYVHAWLVDDVVAGGGGGRIYDWVDSWPTVAAARSCRIDFKDGDVIRGLAPDELERRGLRYVEADRKVQVQVYREWSSTARIGVVPGDDASEDAECNALLNHLIQHSGPSLESLPSPSPSAEKPPSSSSSSSSFSATSTEAVVADCRTSR